MTDTTPIRDFLRTRLLRPGAPVPGEDDPLFSSGRIDSFGPVPTGFMPNESRPSGPGA